MSKIGKRIKQARLAAGINRCALARQSGVSRGTVIRVEAGNNATDETIRALAKAIGISLAELYADDWSAWCQRIAAKKAGAR